MGVTGDPIDHSGTVASGTVSQEAAPAKMGRIYLVVENIDASEDLWVNFGAPAAVNTPGSIQLKPAGSITFPDGGDNFVPGSAVNVTATTTGHKFTCKDY